MQTTQTIPAERSLPAAPDTRPGVIFRRTVRDNIPNILSWGGGYSALLVLVVLLFPALQANDTLLGIVRSLGLLGVASNNAIPLEALGGFAGYIGLQALSWAPVVFAIYLVPQGLNIVMREEERGTLDLLLSTPVTRWRLLTEKVLAVVVSLLLILGLMWLALILSTRLIDQGDVTLANLTLGILHVLPVSLVILMATVLLSVSVRGSRTAAGWIALFLIGSYFLRTISDLMVEIDVMQTIKLASVFAYYRIIATLADGWQAAYDLTMLTLAAALFGLALWRFQRRDIGA